MMSMMLSSCVIVRCTFVAQSWYFEGEQVYYFVSLIAIHNISLLRRMSSSVNRGSNRQSASLLTHREPTFQLSLSIMF